MRAYLLKFNAQHQLGVHITFDAEVISSVEKSDRTWRIHYRKGEETITIESDYLLVASGIFNKPHLPEGVNADDESIYHAESYKSPEPFAGKHVVVIGAGFTGCEITADVAKQAAKVTQIVHRPHWVLPKYLTSGHGKESPIDFAFYVRSRREKSLGLPLEQSHKNKAKYFRQICQAQCKLGIEPTQDDRLPPFVAISDEYIYAAQLSRVDVVVGHKVIKAENGCVQLEDGTHIFADALICCTGYRSHLGFLPEDVLNEIHYEAQDVLQPLCLQFACLPIRRENIAFTGMYRGPYFAVMELQARLAMALFAGKHAWPEQTARELAVQDELAIREQQPRPQFPHGDYIGLADELARFLGILPDIAALQTSDPELYELLQNQPVIPAHYRVVGLDAQPKLARELMQEVLRLQESGFYRKATASLYSTQVTKSEPSEDKQQEQKRIRARKQ